MNVSLTSYWMGEWVSTVSYVTVLNSSLSVLTTIQQGFFSTNSPQLQTYFRACLTNGVAWIFYHLIPRLEPEPTPVLELH